MTAKEYYINIARTLVAICMVFCINIAEAAKYKFSMNVKVKNKKYEVPYYATTNLNNGSSISRNAIIVIHGTNRNAYDYFTYIKAGADIANDTQSVIIAPQFATNEDIEHYSMPSKTLAWSSSGWKIGNKSQGKGRISSFAVLEQFIEKLSESSSNLETITITGHSAGAQYVNRFAAGNSVESSLPKISFQYVIANPSSYLYFSPERITAGTTNTFAAPTVSSCLKYDDYKYGTQNISNTSYMASVGATELATRYNKRKVVYLLGEDDIKDTGNLDTRCQAMLQGAHRLERGNNYYSYLGFFFGHGVYDRHTKDLIPNVGHDASKIYKSKASLFHLFKYQTTGSAKKKFESLKSKTLETKASDSKAKSKV